MTKKRILLVIVFLVILISIIVFTRSRPKQAEKVLVSEPPLLTEKEPPSVTVEDFSPPAEHERITESVIWGRDPFLSPLVKVVLEEEIRAQTALSLTGIVRDEKGAQAVIGDYIVYVGDIINGKEVVSIGTKEVVLRKGKDKEILRLLGEE
jgi:NhaP-type Na+/H+ and K+/H+ antiporter